MVSPSREQAGTSSARMWSRVLGSDMPPSTHWARGIPLWTVTTVGAVDVHYDNEGGAAAALIVCSDFAFTTVVAECVASLSRVSPYEPGALFKRELPCITAVLGLTESVDLLVVDGYAALDPNGRPGLGAHAAEALGIPVIGAAKTPFRGATHAVEVVRGDAARPLYVTAAGGLQAAEAAHIVAGMAGPHRIPSALSRVDRLARGREEPIMSDGRDQP
jgi:deoxyribonuclease V